MALAGYDTPIAVISDTTTTRGYSGSLTVADGELIEVCFEGIGNSGVQDTSAWTVTLNGSPMAWQSGTTTGDGVVGVAAIFSAIASGSGAQTVALTTALSCRGMDAHAYRITGFDTTTPIANAGSGDSFTSSVLALTSPNGITTGADGNAVIGCIGMNGGNVTALAVSGADGSLTGRTGTNQFSDVTWGTAQKLTPSAGSVSFAWTWATYANKPAAAWVEINAAAGSTAIAGDAAGSMPMAGAAAGDVDVVGAGVGSMSIGGAGSGTVGVKGDAAGAMPIGGTGSGTVGSSPIAGDASGTMPVGGAATGDVDVAGDGAGAMPIGGAAAGHVIDPAVATWRGSVVTWRGDAAEWRGTSAVTGDAAGTMAIGGGAAGAVDIDGAGAGSMPMAGSAQGAVSVDGDAAGSMPLGGDASGSVGSVPVAGDAAGALPIGGTATGGVDVSGAGAGDMPLGGVADGGVVVAGDASGTIPLGGVADGGVEVAGVAAGAMPLDGTAAGVIGAPVAAIYIILASHNPPGFRAPGGQGSFRAIGGGN